MQTAHLNGKRTKAIFLTIIAGLLWGTSFPAIKVGLDYVDPYLFVFLRFIFASGIMIIVMFLTKKLTFPSKEKKLILFLGVINGAAYLMQYVGMEYTTAAKAALFINLSAIWVALLSPKLQSDRLDRRRALGILTAFIGVLFVTTNLDFTPLMGGQLAGDLMLIGSGLVWAFFTIYNKNLIMASDGVQQSLTWILPATLIPMVPFVFPSASQISALPTQAWLAIIYTAVACWIIPYYLWLEGLKYISASTSAILLLSEILVATAISWLFLGEVLTEITVAGACLIVASIVIVSYHSSKITRVQP